MLTDAQVYCMTSMIYLFRPPLTAKAIYRKMTEAKLYNKHRECINSLALITSICNIYIFTHYNIQYIYIIYIYILQLYNIAYMCIIFKYTHY